MARYLNPQKISLLVLTSLYCESLLPSEATIPVLSFLTSQIISPAASDASAAGSRLADDCILTIHDFETVIASHKSGTPAKTLFDLFLEALWSIDSLDALHAFFDGLSDLLAQPRQDPPDPESRRADDRRIRLSRISPLGIFVRRAQLEFARLQFHDTSKLWLAFVNYKQPTAGMWQRLNGHMADQGFDSNMSELGLSRADGLFQVAYGQLEEGGGVDGLASMDDVERLLAFQIDRLQRLGNRVPDNMRDQLRKMLGPASAVPSLAHFVRFFDAWRAGDYTSSFDNLHRYFDYTMQTRDKTYYQYALLHMAILQADFGCFSEAIAAMNETIATARENQDMSCLNFSLSWLNHLAKAHPKQIRASGYGGMLGSERDGLAFLKSKAKETKIWSLLSSTLLSEAKMLLANGSSVPRAFEHIFQSAHLNVMHNIRSNIGSQMLMQASLYGRLGLTHLSDVSCDMLRVCYSAACPLEEVLRSTCHSAYISSQAGDYAEAFKMLQSVDTKDHRTLKFHQYIINYTALLVARRALRRSDRASLTHHLHQLHSFAPSDPEIQYQLSLLTIEQHMQAGSFAVAYHAIEDLAAELKDEDADCYQRIHLLTLKAQLFAQTGDPEKGFSVAMRAASAAHRARLWPALWEALGCLAGTLVSVGECGAAKRIGDAVIPQALEGGDQALCAKLYLVQADACVGIAGQENDAPERRQERIREAEVFLDKARECFEKIEDVRGECETLAKKVLVEKLRADSAVAADTVVKYIHRYRSTMERSAASEVGFG